MVLRALNGNDVMTSMANIFPLLAFGIPFQCFIEPFKLLPPKLYKIGAPFEGFYLGSSAHNLGMARIKKKSRCKIRNA